MKVAVICEFSGVVRDAFIKLGHDAISFDLLPTEQPGPHEQGDIMRFDADYWRQFDLAICHPPCTYLSNAGARFLYPQGVLNTDRLALGLGAKEFFMYLYNLPVKRVCIENPVPSTAFQLPAYDQVVQPWMFGHEYSKKTCLWLRNLPPLFATAVMQHSESTKIPGNWFNKGGKDRQKNRAKTFQGLADAMAAQWG